MQAKFGIYRVSSDGNAVTTGRTYEFSSLEACFDYLAAEGHRIESAELIDRASISGRQIDGVKPERDLSVIYEDTTDFSMQVNPIIMENVSLYHIKQTQGNNVPFASNSRRIKKA